MAQNNDGTNLDLAQILQTLANLSPMPNVAQAPYDPSQLLLPQTNSIPGPEPGHPAPIPYSHEQSRDPRLSGRPAPQHHQPPKPQNRASTPIIDPSTITEWKHGLRCVNKIASQNPNFVPAIQKLIKDQEQNVKAWAAGRERLNKEQVAQRENEQKFRAAVSLPGVLEGTAPLRTPEREREEQDQYIQKVYRASKQMVESQSAALKALGVPFFGVKPELLLPGDVDTSNSMESPDDSTVGKITKKQVLELQRKMLNHLMEMYGD